MGKTRLLQAVCTVAMLAAVPALAQQTAQSNDPNAPSASPTATGASPSATADQSSPMSHPMHHSRHRAAAMRGTGDSQNAAVDRLNDQSFQAAQQGQTFGGGADSGSPGMAPSQPPMGAGGASGGAMPAGGMGGAMAPAPGSSGNMTKP
jgi:outer membrane scaffolding protein for murein synthesis (MipA/OmpV family)